MTDPSFAQLLQASGGEKPVVFVDIPKDLDTLILWMYKAAKDQAFPVTLTLLGKKVDFMSVGEMLGYAKGLRQTSECLFESESSLS